jgi:hypothetical protein
MLLAEPNYLLCLARLKAEVARGPEAPPVVVHP